MTLTLSLNASETVPIEVEGILPETVGDKSLPEIERMEIFLGNRRLPLAELFRAAGDPSDGQIDWRGDMSGVHWIGARMGRGTIRVLGDAGRHLGSEMSGGEIQVQGDASDWVGAEMHGGLIHVHGRAGHLAGAAYRGNRRGMTAGVILIDGDAGNELGHTMRRGLLAVRGDIGDLAGLNMIAGTILVLGNCGIRHGAGMRRGTIGLFGPQLPSILPTFRLACRLRPAVCQLIFRQLGRYDFAMPDDLSQADFELYHGDMIEGGRGEILVRGQG